jgi:outer membrane receptor protein involved in Fe transport
MAALAIAASSTAMAQDPLVDDADVITVTGSRLADPNIESSSPVTTIDAELFDVRGTTDVIDLVNTLPQAFAAQTTSFANGANGTSTLDLRGLGAIRTLVLANGKRLPPGSPLDGGYPSDINLIPAQLVERVEIVTGGASAVYGSDAIAGVANFILRDDFEGFEIDGLYGFNQSNNNSGFAEDALLDIGEDPIQGSTTDNDTFDITGIFGANVGGGRGNVTGYFRYLYNDGIQQADRDFSRCALAEFGSEELFCLGSNQGPFPTTFVVSPTGEVGNFNPLLGPDGQPILGADGNPVTSGAFSLNEDGSLSSGFNNAFNFNPLNPIRRQVERFNAGFNGHYDITDNVTGYLEFGFTKSNSPQVIAPSAAFGSSINQVNCDNPLLTPEQLALICGVQGADGTFSRDEDGDGFAQAEVRRRFVEGGGRTDDRTLTNFRVVGGFRGTFAENWDWDVFGQYAETTLNRIQTQQVLQTNLERALDIVEDPTTGEAVCRSTINGTDPDCVAFRTAYDPNATNAPGLADYIDSPSLTTGATQQTVVGGTLQSDLGNYGIASPFATDGINFLAGFEYRRDQLQAQADITNANALLVGSGGAVPPTNGATELWELYTEAAIPLVQGMQGVEELGLTAAYRRSSYSSEDILNDREGGEFDVDTYAVGLTWTPVSDIRFRAQYQRAIRAPNVFELFNPQNTGLTSLTDPCSGFAGSAEAPTASLAECQRTGVTAAQYGAIPPDSGQLNVITGGNPDLEPEVSDTYTVGAVWEPRQIDGLTMSIDYYDITVEEAITNIPTATTLNGCLSGERPALCSLINRGTDGSLTQVPRENAAITATDVNIGGFATTGIDFSAAYRYSIGSYGDLRFGYNSTYQLTNETTPIAGGATFDCVGYFDADCGNPTFDYRHNLTTTWLTPWDVRASLLWRYFSSVERIDEVDGSDIITFGDVGNGNLTSAELDAENYLDFAIFWDATETLELRFGVNNLLDNDPQVVPQFGPSPTANVEGNTVAGVYTAEGRFIFFGANIRF